MKTKELEHLFNGMTIRGLKLKQILLEDLSKFASGFTTCSFEESAFMNRYAKGGNLFYSPEDADADVYKDGIFLEGIYIVFLKSQPIDKILDTISEVVSTMPADGVQVFYDKEYVGIGLRWE